MCPGGQHADGPPRWSCWACPQNLGLRLYFKPNGCDLWWLGADMRRTAAATRCSG